MSYSRIPAELRLRQALRIKLVQEQFTYNPETGKIYFLPRKFNNSRYEGVWNKRFAYKECTGSLDNSYIKIPLLGMKLYAHQVAFILMKSYLPKEVDHRDKNRSNNKWDNLREADRFKNSANIFKRKKNTSGYKGVSWAKSNNMWRMDIRHNNIRYHSYHRTKEEAYEAYCLKSAKLHKEFGCVE